MEKLLVAVFENEAKALEGARLLWELDREGEISVYALQTVAKEPDGSLCVIDNTEVARFPMLAAGTAVGALIGSSADRSARSLAPPQGQSSASRAALWKKPGWPE